MPPAQTPAARANHVMRPYVDSARAGTGCTVLRTGAACVPEVKSNGLSSPVPDARLPADSTGVSDPEEAAPYSTAGVDSQVEGAGHSLQRHAGAT